ncbi:hypothetical protein [Hymenobacter jeollabukensis]|uniref:Uncharacterized protein n=1 Tax=Hymenobacter jeollabukensis TaxID=2025313 RepID=A0A5R8WTS6_9BACT|nr:hypothetical protein [Hymenobacter jeollabukensis]TLM94316.1 hypothetical protein FDY95_09950 [Hymenobacter jeollabukensis]
MSKLLFQEHRLRLVLFFVAWGCCLAAFGQQADRTLFPRMRPRQSFAPALIKGELPEAGRLRVTDSEVRVGPEPLRRNGKTYWEIDLYYDRQIYEAFRLRQQGDTVWLAINPELTEWAPDADSAQSRRLRRSVQRLHQEYTHLFPEPPQSFEENVFLRFNAKVGEEWACLTRIKGSVNVCWVTLDAILNSQQLDPLYVFSVRNSSNASHTPQLMKLVVSKTRGIRGMLWYDYACWEPYHCEDLLVRYGNWE